MLQGVKMQNDILCFLYNKKGRPSATLKLILKQATNPFYSFSSRKMLNFLNRGLRRGRIIISSSSSASATAIKY